MPTRQQLLSARRQDLVGLINKVGGFTEVGNQVLDCVVAAMHFMHTRTMHFMHTTHHDQLVMNS
jgi:hypothetical protein